MGQVNVLIAGKTYRMACDDGQEAHLTELGERLNDMIEQLRERFGEIGDQRLTVMAAITMADQSSETERRMKQLETELSGLEEARAASADREEVIEGQIAQAIEAIAGRLEAVAERLADDEHAEAGG